MVKFILAALTLLVTAFLGAIATFDLFDAYMERLKTRGPVGEFLHNLILSQGLRVLLFIVAMILIYWGIRENLKLRRHIDPEKLAELEGKQWHETARYDLTESKERIDFQTNPAQPEYELKARPLAPGVTEYSSAPVRREEKPNLVFKKPERLFVHSQYGGILEEGRNTSQSNFDPDNVGIVLPVENEFNETFKAIPVSGVTAQLTYDCGTEEPFRVNRGAWLGGANRTGFRVNDIQRLIVAIIIPSRTNEPLVVAIHKEYQNEFNHLENLVRILDGDYHRVRVKLISEGSGTVYADADFELEIIRDPFSVELTARVELTTAQIHQRLEHFLTQGNRLLKDFPKEKEKTDDDVKAIDSFEEQVVKFLKRIDRFSIATFLSDVPVVKFGGPGAHSSNWPSLNRLTTRIARIRDMVDEARRG
jgi:hypothetical protein